MAERSEFVEIQFDEDLTIYGLAMLGDELVVSTDKGIYVVDDGKLVRLTHDYQAVS